MRHVFTAAAISCALLLSACNAVYTRVPVGDAVVQLKPEEWQGTWLGDEIVVVTTVLDGEKGLLEVAWIERGVDGATLEIEKSIIRSSAANMYANIRHAESEEPRYVWIRIDLSANKLTTWAPSVETFEAMVKDGRLDGAVLDDDVVLNSITAEQLEMINMPSNNLLDWSEPRVFYRIAD